MINGGAAVFSECGLYRYTLYRDLSDGAGPGLLYKPMALFMVNPSTADAKKNDNTIRKGIKLGIREGATHLAVINEFAFKATDINVLRRAAKNGIDVVGPKNDQYIHEVINECRNMPVVVAWGRREKAPELIPKRTKEVLDIIKQYVDEIYCLKFTKSGDPWHPLMVRDDEPLKLFWQVGLG